MNASEWKLVCNSNKPIQNLPQNALTSPSKQHHTVIAKGDSAASNHYWALRDTMVLDDLTDDNDGPTVILSDISTLTAS